RARRGRRLERADPASGRSMNFSNAIRAAAGRGPERGPAEQEPERVEGDLGIGRGGAAAASPRRTTNALVNERIRAGARIVRSVQLRDGLALDLDDPWR